MVGCIVTGHNDFPIGMKKALEMIAGEQQDVVAVPFHETDSLEDYERNVKEAAASLYKSNGSVVLFADLLGGTPFNIAMVLKNERPWLEVVTGTNLPMLLEFVGQKLQGKTASECAGVLIETGQAGITLGEITVREEQGDDDGI